MVMELCTCGWGIAGVKRLPPHQHLTWQKIRRQDDGRTFAFAGWFTEQDGYDLLDTDEIVIVSIDWKALARLPVSPHPYDPPAKLAGGEGEETRDGP